MRSVEKQLSKLFRWLRRAFLTADTDTQNKMLILHAQQLAAANRKLNHLSSISEVEFSAFSQWGEDGIIDWLVSKLPTIPKTFVEFGVEDYTEANTRLLLQLHNWRGLVIDGSRSNIDRIQEYAIHWRHHLTAIEAFIDRSNINQLITQGGMTGDIGLLSIDIDGNDYWVWQAIECVSPSLVVIEYNAVFGDINSVSVPYDAGFRRQQAHYSNLYFGASLPAMLGLASEKGYTFLGTSSSGVNAFFVRDDLASDVVASLEKIWAYPSLTREARHEDGKLANLNGPERAEVIDRLPLVDVANHVSTCLHDLPEIYSDDWKYAQRSVV